jgi:hypothetical protein
MNHSINTILKHPNIHTYYKNNKLKFKQTGYYPVLWSSLAYNFLSTWYTLCTVRIQQCLCWTCSTGRPNGPCVCVCVCACANLQNTKIWYRFFWTGFHSPDRTQYSASLLWHICLLRVQFVALCIGYSNSTQWGLTNNIREFKVQTDWTTYTFPDEDAEKSRFKNHSETR